MNLELFVVLVLIMDLILVLDWNLDLDLFRTWRWFPVLDLDMV